MGWKTQKISRFGNGKHLISIGVIEDDLGNDLDGRFYRVIYGTGPDRYHPNDAVMFEKAVTVFLKNGDTLKYYVPNPPFTGQDAAI